MFPFLVVFSLILVLTAADASPAARDTNKGTLSFATRIYEQGIHGIVDRDRARVRAIIQGYQTGPSGASSVIAENNINGVFVTEVGVGNPETKYTLVVDTASSNTWVGAIKPYVKTNTSQDTGHAFHMGYGQASVTGEEWTDTVTLSPGLVVRQQSIGVAHRSDGFANQGFDGILGLGPVSASHGTVDGVDSVPTVLDNLYSQGTIQEKVLGVAFVPYCERNSGGKLSFGEYDEGVTISPVVYAPLETAGNASVFWGMDLSVSYGEDVIMPSTAGVVDTATSLILLRTDAFKAYQSMTGATYDNTTQLYKITQDQYDRLQPLVFYIGGVPLVLPPNAQIIPRSLDTDLGGAPGAIYLATFDMGDIAKDLGFDFILGYAFLERYYSVYDATNKRVGFAATPYTFSQCN